MQLDGMHVAGLIVCQHVIFPKALTAMFIIGRLGSVVYVWQAPPRLRRWLLSSCVKMANNKMCGVACFVRHTR
jgi:hypothetical protein